LNFGRLESAAARKVLPTLIHSDRSNAATRRSPYCSDPLRYPLKSFARALKPLKMRSKLMTRQACGFRGCTAVTIASYHCLGTLMEPEFTHRLCRRSFSFLLAERRDGLFADRRMDRASR